MSSNPRTWSSRAQVFAQRICHGIVGNSVFNVISYDKPVRSLTDPFQRSDKFSRRPATIVRHFVYSTTIWISAVAIIAIAGIRVVTLRVFRSQITGKPFSLSTMDLLRTIHLALSTTATTIGLVVCDVNARGITALNRATRNRLSGFQVWAWEGTHPSKAKV